MAFLCTEGNDLVGTGFFVGLPLAGFPEGGFSYLITAAHVARQLGNRFSIRINSRAGRLINPVAVNVNWVFHSGADVAAATCPSGDGVPFAPAYVPSAMFATRDVVKRENIGPCDPIFVVGLFAMVPGTDEILPIVHAGHVAMVPGEPIATLEGPLDAYLIEARVNPGISGAPVFVLPDDGCGKIRLLGLLQGFWQSGTSGNTGVSVVVPAASVAETLELPYFVGKRQLELSRLASGPIEE